MCKPVGIRENRAIISSVKVIRHKQKIEAGPSESARPYRGRGGFTLIEVMGTSLIVFVLIGVFVTALTMFQRISLNVDPRVHSLHVQRAALWADLLADARESVAVYAFASSLEIDGAPFRATTVTPILTGRAVWSSSAKAFSDLQSAFAGRNQTLSMAPTMTGLSESCILFVGFDGRVRSYWVIANEETSGDDVGLKTTVERFADAGAGVLQRVGYYEQYLVGATIASPGGADSSTTPRDLAGFRENAAGWVDVRFPSAQLQNEALSFAGRLKPESIGSSAWDFQIRPQTQPRS